jgi:hypothetical protein
MTIAPDEPNGILGSVPGEVISAASHRLPPAEKAARDARHTVEIDGPDWVGRVRITFTLHRWKHGKAHMSGWVAVHAERV